MNKTTGSKGNLKYHLVEMFGFDTNKMTSENYDYESENINMLYF